MRQRVSEGVSDGPLWLGDPGVGQVDIHLGNPSHQPISLVGIGHPAPLRTQTPLNDLPFVPGGRVEARGVRVLGDQGAAGHRVPDDHIDGDHTQRCAPHRWPTGALTNLNGSADGATVHDIHADRQIERDRGRLGDLDADPVRVNDTVITTVYVGWVASDPKPGWTERGRGGGRGHECTVPDTMRYMYQPHY